MRAWWRRWRIEVLKRRARMATEQAERWVAVARAAVERAEELQRR